MSDNNWHKSTSFIIKRVSFRLGADTHIRKQHTVNYPDDVIQYAAEVVVKKIPDQHEVFEQMFPLKVVQKNLM